MSMEIECKNRHLMWRYQWHFSKEYKMRKTRYNMINKWIIIKNNKGNGERRDWILI